MRSKGGKGVVTENRFEIPLANIIMPLTPTIYHMCISYRFTSLIVIRLHNLKLSGPILRLLQYMYQIHFSYKRIIFSYIPTTTNHGTIKIVVKIVVWSWYLLRYDIAIVLIVEKFLFVTKLSTINTIKF